MSADDFGEAEKDGVSKSARWADKRKRQDEGTTREWLKVYETVPAQMLNAYGEAKYAKLTDATVWEALTTPLKSGAKWMTEYASAEKERRGIAANRWLKAMADYIEYQEREAVKKQNAAVMKEKMYDEFYAELAKIKPAVLYCLAPKKVAEKSGAASLRSGTNSGPVSAEKKSPQELDDHSKVLYEFLDTKRMSRIRMMLQWQSAGGLPFVVSVHHREIGRAHV